MPSKATQIAMLVVFLVTFQVFLATLCSTVTWDDAGELALAGAVLGVSHPPGQPMHALTGRLFQLLPFGQLGAFRMNMMSAFFGAVCASLMVLLPRTLPVSQRTRLVAGIAAACVLPFGRIFWEHSLITENSTLHAFFVLLVWLALAEAGRIEGRNQRS